MLHNNFFVAIYYISFVFVFCVWCFPINHCLLLPINNMNEKKEIKNEPVPSSSSSDSTSLDVNVPSIKCPFCTSVDVDVDISETEVYYEPFVDENGKTHNHDENSASMTIVCLTCGSQQEGPVPDHMLHRCWCGWVQSQ